MPQNKAQGQLRFDAQAFDFGTIEEAAGPVSHTFLFANTSGTDAFIASVSPSCSCTTAYYEHKTIHPGEYGELTVTYDPTALPGQFRQNVLVLTSDKRSVRLYIEGVVKERDKGIDEKYPYFIADGLQASLLSVRFGFIPQGQVGSKTLGLANTSGKPMKLSYRPDRPDPDLKLDLPAELAPGAVCEFPVEFKIARGRLESLDNAVTIIVDGVPSAKKISLSGYAVHSMDVHPGAPSFRFEPTRLVFGRKKTLKMTIHNDGREELKFLRVEDPSGACPELAGGVRLPGGSARVFKVRRPSADSRLRVFSNDPSRPVRDIILIKQ